MSPHDEKRFTPEGIEILPGPDGLDELDHPIPRWMSWIYVGTICWGIAYLMLMPGIGMNGLNWGQYKAYVAEVAEARGSAPVADPEALAATLVGKPDAMAAGKATFASNCAACHGAAAKGAIGPDLTDATWLYGGTPTAIAHTIGHGTPKGMPPFAASLSAEQLAQVAAFVHGLGGGKSP